MVVSEPFGELEAKGFLLQSMAEEYQDHINREDKRLHENTLCLSGKINEDEYLFDEAPA